MRAGVGRDVCRDSGRDSGMAVGAGRDMGRQGCGQGAGRGQAGKPSAQHSWLALDLDNCSPFPPGGTRREETTSKRKLSA